VQERILNTRSDYDFAGESLDEEIERSWWRVLRVPAFDEDEDSSAGFSLLFVIRRTTITEIFWHQETM